MASLKKISKANERIHRERGQPAARKHLGELEKKGDYKKRAKSYNDKKAALKALHKEAVLKNPDEFYMHMVRSKLKDGVHTEAEPDDVNTPEQTLLLESNDIKYVQHMLHMENKKIDKLKANLQMPNAVGSANVNKKIVFVDSEKQARKYELRESATKAGSSNAKPTREDIHTSMKERKKMYKEMMKRTNRKKQMQTVVDKLRLRKEIANTKRQKVYLEKKGTEESAPVYRWAFQRKK